MMGNGFGTVTCDPDDDCQYAYHELRPGVYVD